MYVCTWKISKQSVLKLQWFILPKYIIYENTSVNVRNMYAYFLKNYFSKVGTQIFHAIGIPVGSDPASFFANLVLFH